MEKDKIICNHCFGIKCNYKENSPPYFAHTCNWYDNRFLIHSECKKCAFVCPKCKGNGYDNWIDSMFESEETSYNSKEIFIVLKRQQDYPSKKRTRK